MQRSAVEDLRRRVERLAAPRRGREALAFGLDGAGRLYIFDDGPQRVQIYQ